MEAYLDNYFPYKNLIKKEADDFLKKYPDDTGRGTIRTPIFLKNPYYLMANEITDVIETLVTTPHLTYLIDDLEICAFEVPDPVYIPVKSTIKIETIIKRIEVKRIINKLRY